MPPSGNVSIRNMLKYSSGSHFVGLWQCSSSSFSHQEPDTSPAAELMPPLWLCLVLLVQYPIYTFKAVLGDRKLCNCLFAYGITEELD